MPRLFIDGAKAPVRDLPNLRPCRDRGRHAGSGQRIPPEEVRRLSDVSAPERRHWLQRAAFFHDEDLRYLRFLIPPGARVLELGCGTGELLAALEPSFGVGVDFSPGMIAQARKAHPDVSFFVGDVENADFIRSLPGPFDAIVVVDTLGALDDCQAMSENLHALCTRETRLVVGYCSHLWYPALKSAVVVGGKRRAERTARIAGRGAITRMSTTLRVTE